MKIWRDVWVTYYTVATRKNYWKQLFASASWLQRIATISCAVVIIYGMLSGRYANLSTFDSYLWLFVPEIIIVLIVDKVRTQTFTENFGGLPEDTAPPESENFRRDRYVLFRDALKKKGIFSQEMTSLIPLIDARLDMEAHHNELMKKFGLFSSGILTALAVPWLKEISGKSIGLIVAWLAVILLIFMLMLWLIPSRKARLKELKYFMMIYERE